MEMGNNEGFDITMEARNMVAVSDVKYAIHESQLLSNINCERKLVARNCKSSIDN